MYKEEREYKYIYPPLSTISMITLEVNKAAPQFILWTLVYPAIG